MKPEDKKEDTLENRLAVKKEAVELATALGYIGGEFHEVTKDGFGAEDIDSLVDLAKNYPILQKGFDVKMKMNKKNLEQLSQADLMEVVLSIFSGFKKGAE